VKALVSTMTNAQRDSASVKPWDISNAKFLAPGKFNHVDVSGQWWENVSDVWKAPPTHSKKERRSEIMMIWCNFYALFACYCSKKSHQITPIASKTEMFPMNIWIHQLKVCRLVCSKERNHVSIGPRDDDNCS